MPSLSSTALFALLSLLAADSTASPLYKRADPSVPAISGFGFPGNGTIGQGQGFNFTLPSNFTRGGAGPSGNFTFSHGNSSTGHYRHNGTGGFNVTSAFALASDPAGSSSNSSSACGDSFDQDEARGNQIFPGGDFSSSHQRNSTSGESGKGGQGNSASAFGGGRGRNTTTTSTFTLAPSGSATATFPSASSAAANSATDPLTESATSALPSVVGSDSAQLSSTGSVSATAASAVETLSPSTGTSPSTAEASATSSLSISDLTARCTSTIDSYDDVDTAVSSGCDITLNSITVPAGEALDLSRLSDGTTVTVAGDVTFTGGTEWEGPMFIIDGSDITFNGGGCTFDGQGATYWDGQGSNGGVTKPKMMKIKMSGTFSNLVVLNTPVQAFSIGDNDAALTISGVTVDNRDGDETDSDGDALGHNTDCFDVSATSVTLDSNTCYNQDDCLAINSGSDITFSNNYCSGGHGISIGSIQSDKTVSSVTISGNTVVSSANGLRIKTVYEATDGSVSDVTYTDNAVSGITEYGIVIEQDYENGSPTGTATNGITISDITFSSGNTVAVEDGAEEVYVLCGDGSCTGTWDWSGLSVSGGDAGTISGDPPITGFSI